MGLYGWCNFQQQTSRPVLHGPDYLTAIRLTGIKDGLDRIYLLIPDDSNMSLYLRAIHCVSLSLYVLQPQRSNPPKCHPFPPVVWYIFSRTYTHFHYSSLAPAVGKLIIFLSLSVYLFIDGWAIEMGWSTVGVLKLKVYSAVERCYVTQSVVYLSLYLHSTRRTSREWHQEIGRK